MNPRGEFLEGSSAATPEESGAEHSTQAQGAMALISALHKAEPPEELGPIPKPNEATEASDGETEKPSTEPLLLRSSAVARILNATQRSVTEWANKGFLPGTMWTPGGRLRVSTEALKAYTGLEDLSESLLKPSQVAKIFNVSIRTVDYWADAGLLACIRTPGRHHRFRRSDVKTYIENNTKARKVSDF